MTPELHSLILIPPGVLRVDRPPRAEWIADWDLLAVILVCFGIFCAFALRRRWT